MKTKLLIEVETEDNYEMFPEEGQSDEDFKGKEKELEQIRKNYAKGLHKDIIRAIKKYFDTEMGEMFQDGSLFEEYYIEGWDELDDYGIKFKVIEDKKR